MCSVKSTLFSKHYLWPLVVTMYTIWNTLLKPPACFSFSRTTFLGTLTQLRDQARTLLYFLTLRNICVSTISGTPSSLKFSLISFCNPQFSPHLSSSCLLSWFCCIVKVILPSFESQLVIYCTFKVYG